jgi:regulator of nucleoside diphosphate kinase
MNVERYLSQRDAAALCRLAEHLLRQRDVTLNCAERLVEVISSSILLPEHATRPNCVSLYSEVTYRHIGAHDRNSIVLVCPNDASDTLARVSTLAPLALALLGRSVGSIVQVDGGGDRIEHVEVLAVTPPTDAVLAQNLRGGQRHSGAAMSTDALPCLRPCWPGY